MCEQIFIFGNKQHGLSMDNKYIYFWLDGAELAHQLKPEDANDIERVIRCKDCEFTHNGNRSVGCPFYEGIPYDKDAYCSYAKRKGGEN